MTFGEAIERMKAGAFVARLGWNGKHQFIYMETGLAIEIGSLRGKAQKAFIYRARTEGAIPAANMEIIINPHIDMMTEDNRIVCGWLASQTDMTATDWYVREYEQNVPEDLA